jgi:autotransporter-associated beta strand protein
MRTLHTDERTFLITSETTRSNKRLRTLWSLIIVFAVILGPARLNADSATWKLNPTNNDWNTAANWTPERVPDQPTDVATFDVSNITDISVAIDFGLDSIVFNPGASAYTFVISQPYIGYITFDGAGVINNSALTQNFDCVGNVIFTGSATAGSEVVYTNKRLLNPSTWILFDGDSNAGSATFVNEGDSPDFKEGYIFFTNSSSAATSSIINEQGDPVGGITGFHDFTTAANSTITTQATGRLQFEDNATSGSATLIADGGAIFFKGSATGQVARVELINGGVLNLGGTDNQVPMTVGSLEGDTTGAVHLGTRHLTVGGNGLSTTFNGVLSGNGSLIKSGNETLTLTGANTYTGWTTVTGGTLLAQAAIGSATGTGPVQVNAGTLGGTGNVTGAVTIGTGTGPGAFLAPGVRGPGTLSISNTLTFKSDGSYKYELGLTPHPRADQASANWVTIEPGARFVLRTRGNQTLALGTIFTVINNTAATPISGVFANLPDGSTIVAGNNTLQVSYEGGDGNDLTLTVVP